MKKYFQLLLDIFLKLIFINFAKQHSNFLYYKLIIFVFGQQHKIKENTNAKVMNYIILCAYTIYRCFGSYLNHQQCESENKHMKI